MANYQQYQPQYQQQQPNGLDFQQFNYPQQQSSNQTQNQYQVPPSASMGRPPMGGAGASGQMRNEEGVSFESIKRAFGTGNYDNESPLLEELGINFGHIGSKGLTVMNPFKGVDKHIMDDTDLAGPLIFCFAFGAFLLLSGKAHFGYIYGIAMLGVISVYAILNLMSQNGVDGYRIASVLGYSMLPIVILSCVSTLLQLSGTIGLLVSAFAVLWSANSASLMFVTVLDMKEQRLLVMYPIALLYCAFALVVVY